VKTERIFNSFAFEHAVRALSAQLSANAAADKVLSDYFRNTRMGSTERGQVAGTVYAVLRHRLSLGFCAGSEYPRDLALAALLRVQGLSVRQVEPLLKGEEDTELAKKIKSAKLEAAPANVRHDLPEWLWNLLAERHGEARASELARALNVPAPLDLRVNTFKSDRDAVLAAFSADGIAASATPRSPTGVRLSDKPALNKHALFLSGAVEVQDEGSQLLCHLVHAKRGEMVADFCAGAGGKTLSLGAMMRSTGRLYAFDVSEGRLLKLKHRYKKSGLSNVHPVRIENENDIKVKRLAGKMDRVLVDAPCSGLGTLRRNPELKWRQTEKDVAELKVKQANILMSASRLVKPGGRLVYATCSLLEEENAQVVEAFLAANPGFALTSAAEVLASQSIALELPTPYLMLDPAQHGTDGFFAAVLTRQAA
jgi:16S rRNA (cytosine967-C5)-methyltransferase